MCASMEHRCAIGNRLQFQNHSSRQFILISHTTLSSNPRYAIAVSFPRNYHIKKEQLLKYTYTP